MSNYINYHKHSHYTAGIGMVDCNVKPIDYAERIIELKGNTLFTTEHGYGGDIFNYKTVADEYGLHCKFGVEGYIVPNPLEKDNRNYHIILIPKTNDARKKLNLASSRANIEGYYYRPRFFIEDLINNFDKGELFITTACIAGLLHDDDSINEIFLPLYKKHGEYVYLEVQSHNADIQKETNKKAIELADKLNLNLIAATDSHYIYPNQASERTELLKGKGISYGDEDEFILDYPSVDELYERFKIQDVLSESQIKSAIENTNVFEECEDIYLDKEVKMPTIYGNLTEDEKIDLLKQQVNEGFKKVMKEDEIPKDKWADYIDNIRKEMQVIIDTQEVHSSDYFLLNKAIVDKAINDYNGVLTRTGRGCFTDKAHILTQTDIKPISNVKIGDKVLGEDCEWHNVLNTYEYDICEDLIEFEYERQGSRKYFKNQCTLDHKILVNRNGINKYIEAKDLIVGDYLCSPKIKHTFNNKIIIDLQDYNKFGYEYDDEYIYEITNVPYGYKYSPRWCEKNIGMSCAFYKRLIDGYIPQKKHSVELAQKLLNNTPFNTLEDYSKYCKSKSKIYKKVKRYIELDELWNLFIGLMYGDGWTQKDCGIGLATNRTTKNGLNKWVIYKIAERLNLQDFVYMNSSKTKNLDQITINSHIINEWFSSMFFKSKKGEDKIFNNILLTQNKILLRWLLIGLKKSDGSLSEHKESFDNTSTSLICAYKVLDNIVNQDKIKPHSVCIREGGIDNRGYITKMSYKLRTNLNIKTRGNYIENDDDYWYLKVEKITILKNQKTKVYDLEVENCHSYTINNIIVHNSCGAYLINKILGITQIDRLSIDLPIYSERFMSTARLIENKSMPDIDFNINKQEPFVRATRDLLGEYQCYPMVAYGTMQLSEAFRNVCRSEKLEYSEVNEVGKQLDRYRDDVYWGKYIKEAEKYVGTITSTSVHPCSHLVANFDIREEIGVIRVGDFICVPMTSTEADEWKYLKEDFLIVTVWDIISKTFELIGEPIISLHELLKVTKDDKRIWDIFKNGYTCTLNQFDTDTSTAYTKIFKPDNIEECAMMVSAIRPAFDNFRDDFLHRREYTTGSKHLDELFSQTHHFILFQECLMKFFEWLGISPSESIGLIKKISKKKIKQKDFDNLEETMRNQWIINTGSVDKFDKIWDDIQATIKYSFNSPHGYATACDALYGAYLKVNYPIEYYTVVLNQYSDKEAKTNRLTEELKHFGVKCDNNLRFRNSSSDYTYDKEKNTIYKGLSSIKSIGVDCANNLYTLKDTPFNSFTELLYYIKSHSLANRTEIEILIKINFFEEFGEISLLLKMFMLFYTKDLYKRKTFKKNELNDEFTYGILKAFSEKETEKQFSGVNMEGVLEYIELHTKPQKVSLMRHMSYEVELLGYTDLTDPNADDDVYIVSDTDYNKYGTPFISLYSVCDGSITQYKCVRKWFREHEVKKGDVLRVCIAEQYKRKQVDGQWVQSDEIEIVIKNYVRMEVE